MIRTFRTALILASSIAAGLVGFAASPQTAGGVAGSITSGSEISFHVPWKPVASTSGLDGLVVLWFPETPEEVAVSPLSNSQTLAVYAASCVTMGVADFGGGLSQMLSPGDKPPVLIMVDPGGGKVLGKVEPNPKNGRLDLGPVEKLVDAQVKARHEDVKNTVKQAKDAEKRGDKDSAIAAYQRVVAEKCLFPGDAKDAENAIKKLGGLSSPDRRLLR